MQSPIVVGTVLQNRYRILSTLGQGGFGRTYLAEDQGRFNERCALKEFIPNQSGMYALEKSKELFQREAAILYQIQHPQIPQFRAIFEENERLFLVQDYVEGKTYRALLNERKAQGSAFSEAEVMQLMRQLLPVLAHIHAKSIIHRDIAPDNIMLRQQDYLPVLIDFGVVKDIATRIQQPETVQQATTVGKLGYAPPEQMQTGRAYPNSDLYGLAVTAIVLMTGKEPQELYDDNALVWDWERYAKVSPAFAQVLNRMMSPRPGDRYQSVSEVTQALQLGHHPTAPQPIPAAPPTGISPTQVSRMQTLAVGRRPEPIAQSTNRRADPVIPSPNRDEESVWDNPWAVVAIAAGLAIVTGIAAWAVVSAVLNTRPTPTATPTPTPSVSLTPTPSPTPTQPTEYDQPLNLAPGESVRVEGRLRPNETVNYVVSGEEGQTLAADVDGEGVLLTVFAADREPLQDDAIRVQSWQGTLDYTGEYYIQLRPVQGLSTESSYSLNLDLEAAPAPEPSPSPSPVPTQSPEPIIDEEQINFPAGSEGTTVSGEASNSVIKRYYINAQEGQILSAAIADGAVTLDIRYPNGQLVEDASGLVEWQAQLPTSGDYIVDVIATEPTDYTLDVSVRNPE